MTRSATKAGTVSTTHTIFVAAPPRVVYDLLADAARWPLIFSSSVHVEKLEAGATGERLRWWAMANGAIRNWTARRAFDPDGYRIRFRQETPLPPVASMCGEWVLVPLPGNMTSVVLLHEFRAIGDDPGNTALIKQAVDRNSTAELAELKTTAELGEQLPHLVHSFADTVIVRAGIGPVYDFLYQMGQWPAHLPHVARVTVDEAVPNVQTVEMQTCGVDGSPQTARMVRVCSPHHSIVYKRIEPPDILSAHLGGWYLYPTAEGVRLTAHNTVMIRPGGPGDTVSGAMPGMSGMPGMAAASNGHATNGGHGQPGYPLGHAAAPGLAGAGLPGGPGLLGGMPGGGMPGGGMSGGGMPGGGMSGAVMPGPGPSGGLHVVGGLPVAGRTNGSGPLGGTNGTAVSGHGFGLNGHRLNGGIERAVELICQSLRENSLAVLAHARKMAAQDAELSLRDSRLPTPAIWVD